MSTPAAPGPILRTPEEVAWTWDNGGLRAWRGQVAIIASNPWAPYGNELKELALAANRPAPVHAIEEAVKVYRSRFERRERELVAREIRQLVAMSGLSQREFAAMAGTSASRLSTYVNGLVTPVGHDDGADPAGVGARPDPARERAASARRALRRGGPAPPRCRQPCRRS